MHQGSGPLRYFNFRKQHSGSQKTRRTNCKFLVHCQNLETYCLEASCRICMVRMSMLQEFSGRNRPGLILDVFDVRKFARCRYSSFCPRMIWITRYPQLSPRCPHAGSRNNPIWGKQKFCGSRFCLAWNSYAFGTGHTYRPWSENLRYSQGLPHWFTVWLDHLYLQLIVLCSRHFVEALNLMRKATYEHMCSISLSACWDSRHLLSQSYILPSDTYRD